MLFSQDTRVFTENDRPSAHTRRSLEAHLETSIKSAANFEMEDPFGQELIATSFLDYVPAFSQNELDLIRDIFSSMSTGEALKTVAHFSLLLELAKNPDRRNAGEHLVRLLRSIENDHPAHLVALAIASVVKREECGSAPEHDLTQPSELAKLIDLSAHGYPQWLARDVIGLFNSTKELIAIVEPTISSSPHVKTSSVLDPRIIDDVILCIKRVLPRFGYPLTLEFLTACYAEIIVPFARASDNSTAVTMNTLFPGNSIDDRAQLQDRFEKSYKAASEKVKFRPDEIPPKSWECALQAARKERDEWERSCSIYGVNHEFSPADSAPFTVPGTTISISLVEFVTGLSSIAAFAREKMQKLRRKPTELSRIRWTPRFCSDPDRFGEAVDTVLAQGVQYIPEIETQLGVKCNKLSFRALYNLFGLLSTSDSSLWQRVSSLLSHNPAVKYSMAEALFTYASGEEDIAVFEQILKHIPAHELGGVIQAYLELATATDGLEDDVLSCKFRSELSQWREATRRVMQLAKQRADKCLRNFVDRFENAPTSLSSALGEMGFFRSEVIRSIVIELGRVGLDRPDGGFLEKYFPTRYLPLRLPENQFSILEKGVGELSHRERTIIGRMAHYGLLEYPREVAVHIQAEFDRDFASLSDRSVRLQMLNGHIAAVLFISEIDNDTVCVEKLYARPEVQRSGLALQFLKASVHALVERGKTVEAWMWERHGAWAAYEAIGFRKIGYKDDFYPGVVVGFFQLQIKVTES